MRAAAGTECRCHNSPGTGSEDITVTSKLKQLHETHLGHGAVPGAVWGDLGAEEAEVHIGGDVRGAGELQGVHLGVAAEGAESVAIRPLVTIVCHQRGAALLYYPLTHHPGIKNDK